MSRRLEELNAFLLLCPLHRWLGCSIVETDPATEKVVLRLPHRAELRRGPDTDVAHGGVVSCFADIATHAAVYAVLSRGIPTIDLRVDYLRPALLPLTAIAFPRRVGGTVGTADVEIYGRDEKLAAIGRAVFMTQEPRH